MTAVIYILGGIILLLLILGIVAPKTYNVFRTIKINKPKTQVFEHLKYLKKQQEWSPWAKKDPNMEKKFTGTDGEVGAISYWNGNKEVGEGEQEITKIIEGERIEGELRFLKPWKSTSDCYFDVKEVDKETTEVTWGFSGYNKFLVSIMMLFMNMDKAVGKDFEEGLAALKEQLEA
ncbi:polyketide cyclase/dehydrase/lipid transport protein [Maribacter vaceletii]|uniref:Polyketide cyclase/dehydrase/lipid transport protein n=1 Tax=Maribacter vaceletii TaxID=1206816 RepID=A0A495E9F5_9FLAO|nr:SRPBCC family protein [Maribacter vaceletii]RKR13446.1 polyketide cyclase/dehydrase/lipid transport protein [Maribacter vaceletii]